MIMVLSYHNIDTENYIEEIHYIMEKLLFCCGRISGVYLMWFPNISSYFGCVEKLGTSKFSKIQESFTNFSRKIFIVHVERKFLILFVLLTILNYLNIHSGQSACYVILLSRLVRV